jgi:hypothetical protein
VAAHQPPPLITELPKPPRIAGAVTPPSEVGAAPRAAKAELAGGPPALLEELALEE